MTEKEDGTYYFDENGTMLVAATAVVDGKLYLFDENGRLCTEKGWKNIGHSWYYLTEEGTVKTGWVRDEDLDYFLDPDTGRMVSGEHRVINGKDYTFHVSGMLIRKGWANLGNGNWMLVNDNGTVYTGWILSNGEWYYLDPADDGRMAHSGFCSDGKNMYYFTDTGAMVKGWKKVNGNWYYFASSGEMMERWQEINKIWYYLEPGTGKMMTGWQVIDGLKYYLDDSGRMCKGWLQSNNNWYYLTVSGNAATGWQNINGTWYYMNEDGVMRTGWIQLGGYWYFLNPSGAMVTEWAKLGAKWYYFGQDGSMREGWQRISNAWYYFYYADDPYGGSEGEMAANTTIEGYRVSASGAYYNLVNDLNAAICNAHQAVAVYDLNENRMYTAGSSETFSMASTVKVAILMHLMSMRSLTEYEKSLATKMITYSDNDAATTLLTLGNRYESLQAYFNRLGMWNTTYNSQYWGLTQTTPEDQVKLLKELYVDRNTLSNASADYIIGLMGSVIASQSWGISATGSGAAYELKNGWLPNPDWHVNSIGHVHDSTQNYLIAVYTQYNSTFAQGIQSIEKLAKIVYNELY